MLPWKYGCERFIIALLHSINLYYRVKSAEGLYGSFFWTAKLYMIILLNNVYTVLSSKHSVANVLSCASNSVKRCSVMFKQVKNKLSYSLLPRAFASVIILLGMNKVFAQESDVLINAGQCMAISDAAERIECYDSLATQASDVMPAQAPVVIKAVEVQQEPVLSEVSKIDSTAETANLRSSQNEDVPENFGFQNKKGKVVEKPAEPELLGVIVALEKLPTSNWRFTLDNGQVWRQMQGERFNLKKGFHVRIFKSQWGGSYRVTAEEANNSSVQVMRLK